MSMNAGWHKEHPMPPHPSFEQRLAWHREHARACGCRKPPADIAERLAEEERAASPLEPEAENG